MELIPKENWGDLEVGIKQFCVKHSDGLYSSSDSSLMNQFNSFDERNSYHRLGALRIKNSSVLRLYVSQIIFNAISLSSSFLCLKVTLMLDDELMNRLSKYVVSNVPNQIRLTGFENRHWYDFRYLSNSCFSGSIHKCQTFENIIKDITWNVSKEIRRYIPHMFFTSQKCCPQYVCSVETNVDGNANKDFWGSVGINSRWCDFSPDFTSCIAWRHEGEPLFPFLPPSNADQRINIGIESFHIGDNLCYYLLYEKASEYIRNRLFVFSNSINSTRKNLRSWLKLKVQFDTEMFFPVRFLNEIEKTENLSFPYITLRPDKTTIISSNYLSLFDSIQRTTTLYNRIRELFQSNIDYRNAKNNYSLQRKALAVSILAVVVAILSIFITVIIAVLTNENFAMQLCSFSKNMLDSLSFA